MGAAFGRVIYGALAVLGVGGSEVWIGGKGVSMGGTDMPVGVGVACGLHPNNNNRVNPTPQTFFSRYLRFIRTSSVK